MTATARILDHALGLLRLGLPWETALETACRRVSTTPVARERARATFVAILARAERSAA